MKNITVTIVEDNPMIAMVVKKVLVSNGYQVVNVFISTDEAIEYIQKLQSDIIISDLDLSCQLSGYAAAKKIRELLTIPVLFYSDCDDRNMIIDCLLMSNSKFVSKSSPIDNLLSALEEIVDENFGFYRQAI